jgi:hypothetical protein
MGISQIVTPNCRYGHGDLLPAEYEGQNSTWALIGHQNPLLVFAGRLYVCGTCGYTEFFDTHFDRTVQEVKKA